MKKKSLLAMSLMGLALVACSEDEQLNGGTGNTALNENDGAFVSLTLDIASPETKGNPNPDNPVTGSSEENTISNATIVIDYADGETKVVKATTTATGEDDPKVSGNTITFKAPEGQATFYVYANLPSADDISATTWEPTTSSKADASTYWGDNNFFMSNKDGQGVDATIEENNNNVVNVSIERAAVKVSVESVAEPAGDDEIKGTINTMSFKLGNMASDFYLLANTSLYTSGITGIDYTDMASWTDVTPGTTAYKGSSINTTTLATLPHAYCLENLQENYYTQNTTYIKFNTKFIPGQALTLKAKDGESGKFVVDKLDNVTAESPATFYVVRAGDTDKLSNYIMGTSFDSNTGITLTQDGTSNFYTVANLEGITKVEKYDGGTCYFGPIWINDQVDASVSPIYRNDWYHLKVTSITLPGSSSEPNPEEDDDPETPLVSDVDITVQAAVLPWNLEEKSIELK